MRLTQAQYDQISECFPHRRGKLAYSNLQILDAFLYVAENGCKWRALPEKYGNWHTIYTRISRWAKAGVLDKAFAKLQEKQIVRIKIDVISMDSTSVKIHPDVAARNIIKSYNIVRNRFLIGAVTGLRVSDFGTASYHLNYCIFALDETYNNHSLPPVWMRRFTQEWSQHEQNPMFCMHWLPEIFSGQLHV